MDPDGWKDGPNGRVPAVSLLVRKGNPGFNSNEAEATFKSRPETEWPLARTVYQRYYLCTDGTLSPEQASDEKVFELQALGKSDPLHFSLTFDKETEIAGHPTANLVFAAKERPNGTAPTDIDVFVTLRHFDPSGKEVFYTGEL